MLTLSKPLSAARTQAYHKEEFANARENYYSEGDHIRGEWHGKLANQSRVKYGKSTSGDWRTGKTR